MMYFPDRFRFFPVLSLMLFLTVEISAQEEGELAVTVSPPFAWLTEAAPYGSIRLENTGSRTSEVIIEVDYGEIKTLTGEGDGVVFNEPSTLGDLSPHLVVFPPRTILAPGEVQTVRYSVRDAALLPAGGYVAMVRCLLIPRIPVGSGQIPASSAGVQINYALIIPILLIRGDGLPRIHAELVAHNEASATIFLQSESGLPWGGWVRLESADGTRVYGTSDITLYTERELKIPLDTPLGEQFRVVFDDEIHWLPPLIQSRLAPPPPILITR